jgi:PIN domain nuclease of toxin-antitoxin system
VSDRFVLDASAVLCLLQAEKGAERVAEALPNALISAVNLSEVVAKLSAAGGDEGAIDAALEALQLNVVPFDRAQARAAGLMRAETRRYGLSLGDRACLALGQIEKAPVLTCDASWMKLEPGYVVELLR